MKKTFLGVFAAVILSSILFVSAASATDICSNDPLSSADYNVEITSAVFLRDISCMMESNVIATLPAGEVVHVIGRTEGWHKIERADGSTGWLWETFVTSTTKPFNATTVTPEPDPEPTLYTEPEPVVYSPMYDISGYKYETAIWYVYNQGIVGGYPDGSYQANRVINRAELLKIIVEAAYDNEFESYGDTSCFSDVPVGQWYTPYVCFAKSEGIVQGYGDGSFQPAAEINFVEALKMAMVGFGNEYTEGDPWYRDVVELGGTQKAIPIDIKSFSVAFTRGQMAEMITRVMKGADGVLETYLGEDIYNNYNVDYSTIDAGVDVEDLVGTGECVVDGEVCSI